MTDSQVAIPQVMNDTEAWSNVDSFEAALNLLAEAGIDVHSTEEFGDGFKVLEDKDKLVGQAFIITGIRFSEKGDFGEFAILHLVTRDALTVDGKPRSKFIITDGSTGIYSQAKLYTGKGMHSGIYVADGLVRSDYEYEDEKGKKTPAKTYYLS